MGTFQRPNRLFFLAIIGLSTILAACSSGGGSSGKAANDTRPDPFALSAPSDIDLDEVAFDTPIVSDPVTIKGIDTAAPVSIEGGEYAIGDGEFTNAPGTVRNGQNVRVRVQSPVKAEQTATATLNIGGVTESFTVTTGPDTIPPEVAILFPPPASMTEGATLFLRGTVKDANGTLEESAVKVNEVYADLKLNEAGDEGTWEVTVDLAPGENTVTVTAADTAENVNDEESVASRRVESIAGESFPDNENPFFSAFKADIGVLNEKLTAFVTDDSRSRPGVVAVDLATGTRSIVADNSGVEDSLQFQELQSVHYAANGKLYVSDYSAAIFELDLQKNTRRSIALLEEGSLLSRPKGMVLRDQNKLFVADNKRIYWINTETLEQTVFSSAVESIPDGQNAFEGGIWSLVFDANKIYVAEWNNKVFSVDITTGARQVFAAFELAVGSVVDLIAVNKNELIYLFSGVGEAALYKLNLTSKISTVLSGSTDPNEINAPAEAWGIAGHRDIGYVLLIDRAHKAVMGVDLETGVRVVISKSVAQE